MFPHLESPCSLVPMFPSTYVPPPWIPLFPSTYVPQYLCSQAPMFPSTYVPPPWIPLFPSTYVPQHLCSPTLNPPVPQDLCSPAPMFSRTDVPQAWLPITACQNKYRINHWLMSGFSIGSLFHLSVSRRERSSLSETRRWNRLPMEKPGINNGLFCFSHRLTLKFITKIEDISWNSPANLGPPIFSDIDLSWSEFLQIYLTAGQRRSSPSLPTQVLIKVLDLTWSDLLQISKQKFHSLLCKGENKQSEWISLPVMKHGRLNRKWPCSAANHS